MALELTTLSFLMAPMLLALAAAITALTGPLRRGHWVLRLPENAAFAAFGLSLLAALGLALDGPATVILAPGIGVMSDIVSVSLALTVSLVGWVVLRYARTAIDGSGKGTDREADFLAGIAAALASVLLMVTAGTVGQIIFGALGTALAMRGLLLFQRERPAAQRAARYYTTTAIFGTGTLAVSLILLGASFGTGDIPAIVDAVRNGARPDLLWPAVALLCLSAVTLSALVPIQGWLTAVVDAPTPVSALLHAGVVGAGGFLLIRFSDLLLATPGLLAVLALAGGFSALAGAAVSLAQPNAKTALAWSTSAQMGFMVMQIGLALFPLALLHIVAHALYKAHAFLNAGSAVEAVAAVRKPGPVAVPGLIAVARAFALALALFIGIGLLAGLGDKPAQAVALGAILVFGTAYLVAQGLADAAPRALTRMTGMMAAIATLAYFAFQAGAEQLAAGTLPPPPAPDGLSWAVMVLAVASFAFAAYAQATFPLWAGHPAAAGLRVHLMNGLYIDALVDRLTGRFASRASASPSKSPGPHQSLASQLPSAITQEV